LPKSPYLDNVGFSAEKNLLGVLQQEAINLYGINVYYIKNNYTNVDDLFDEDRLPVLTNAFQLAVQLKDAYEGKMGSPMFSKFGFQDQSTISLLVSLKEWVEVTSGTMIRPREGDLIYVPSWNSYGPSDMFKITFIDKYETEGYHPLGSKNLVELECEKWSYGSEELNTGVAEVDAVETENSNDATAFPTMANEPTKANSVVQTVANSFAVFQTENPFGEDS
jgi:hypothetical protein